MTFGSGKYTYRVEEDWGPLPEDWTWGWVPAVACDSQDRVFVYSRSDHPLVVFDREGSFIASWGEDVIKDAHGIWIDEHDNVFCTERDTHCIFKFNREGELVMTIGTPDEPGSEDGLPLNKPTDCVTTPNGEIFVSDGYENARVHHYTADGELVKSWGEWGTGPSQFELCHAIRADRDGRLWVCDRTNDRIEIFDQDGNFLEEWTGLHKPDTIYFDPEADIVYIAEMDQLVSVFTLNGELLSQWGGGEPSDKPGEFIACPHGIWSDSHGDLYVGQVKTDGGLQKFVRQ